MGDGMGELNESAIKPHTELFGITNTDNKNNENNKESSKLSGKNINNNESEKQSNNKLSSIKKDIEGNPRYFGKDDIISGIKIEKNNDNGSTKSLIVKVDIDLNKSKNNSLQNSKKNEPTNNKYSENF